MPSTLSIDALVLRGETLHPSRDLCTIWLTAQGADAHVSVMNEQDPGEVPGLRSLDTGPFGTDFGAHLELRPCRAYEVHDEATIRAGLAAARDARLPWRIRGAGHSCGGQTLTGGVVLVNRTDQPVWRMLDDHRVEVTSATHWLDLERALNAIGRCIAVLPDYLSLTVGGTLSVGGYGVRSVVHGGQIDLVERLRVVTETGEAVWCTATERGDLFRRVLAGGGEHGVIERAVLRTEPYQRVTRWSIAPHADLPSAARSLAWMWRSPPADLGLDAFQLVDLRGAVGGLPLVTTWFGQLRANIDDPPRPSPPHLGGFWSQEVADHPFVSHARRSEIVASHANGARLWSDYLLFGEAFVAFMESLELMRGEAAFSTGLMAIYALAIARPRGKFDSYDEGAAGSPESGMQFGVGVYHVAPHGDDATLESAIAAQRTVQSVAERCGGRFYRYGWRDRARSTHQSA